MCFTQFNFYELKKGDCVMLVSINNDAYFVYKDGTIYALYEREIKKIN